MSRKTNFADPAYEPTDEELVELSHEAFADVTARHQAALQRLYAEVRRLADANAVDAPSPLGDRRA
ncbi:MAG: hypothetical protein HY904_24025 [Deltaproteobacteria bacterium]|nr:hypothetical protein [Deltaproteobacteria bacterium]